MPIRGWPIGFEPPPYKEHGSIATTVSATRTIVAHMMLTRRWVSTTLYRSGVRRTVDCRSIDSDKWPKRYAPRKLQSVARIPRNRDDVVCATETARPVRRRWRVREKVTVRHITKRAPGTSPLTMITAYDYTAALLADTAGVDMILVGDTLGIFALGHADTIPVTMDDMVRHCRAVGRAKPNALVIGDLPFGSYHRSVANAVDNAVRLMQEGRCEAVKLEGGCERVPVIEAIVAAGIPVVGHVGLGPQSSNLLGGNVVQGQTATQAEGVVADAAAVANAGCFAIVVEAVPRRVGAAVSEEVSVPTIGIGAGSECDGQVLVFHEVVGLHLGESPRFAKRYADAATTIIDAIAEYCDEVRTRRFPDKDHSYLMDKTELERFRSQ